ncbi:acyl-CoA N-acyltransferase [Aspergillus multicolor]|uniref:GNAT family N-acetyltransferase n=1 Tax=Aspergillus multicolor TaxID=41759 RepID=UPI003CCDFBFC
MPPITLKLFPVTTPDIHSLITIWFAAFSGDPTLRRLFPDTAGVRAWLTAANQHDLSHKPFQKYVKVVDPDAVDSEGKTHERIVAYAKWDTSSPEHRGSRYPPWHEDIPALECEEFFQREETERERVMGKTKHYYLDTLVTHPDYHRRGAGSMLLQWGCDLADSDGVALYVDASKAGAPLYERFGFVDEGLSGSWDVASMVRPR